jgi:hypothetical protein
MPSSQLLKLFLWGVSCINFSWCSRNSEPKVQYLITRSQTKLYKYALKGENLQKSQCYANQLQEYVLCIHSQR